MCGSSFVASTLAGAPRSPSPHRTRTAGHPNQRAHPCAHQKHVRTLMFQVLTHSGNRFGLSNFFSSSSVAQMRKPSLRNASR